MAKKMKNPSVYKDIDDGIEEGMNTRHSYAKPLNEFGFDMCLACPARFECKVTVRINKGAFSGQVHVALRTHVNIKEYEFRKDIPCIALECHNLWMCNRELVLKMIGCSDTGWYSGEEWPYG